MKKIHLIVGLLFTSFCSFSQLPSLPSLVEINAKPVKNSILQKANEKLKTKNINPQKAKIEDWENVLKEIGEVTKTENYLFCKVTNTSNLALTFQNGELIKVCEMSDDGKPEIKTKD
ncbi:MAG: hypothetical protein ACK4NY_10610 [Spirosomataceae bacterium]